MIITEFSNHTGLIRAGAGYDHISSFRVEDLRELLKEFKDGTEVRLASLPHQDGGNALLMKARDADDPHWICCCPMIGKENDRYPVPIGRITKGEQ